jgi:hypothetical protein
MANAEKGKNSAVLRRLEQEKGALGRDIRKPQRQLITEEKVFREKISNPYQHNISIVL